MVQKTVVTLVDDLTGEEGDVESLTFGLDGASYEIDLGEKNAAELRDSLAQFVAAARRTGGRARSGTARRAAAPAATTKTKTATGQPKRSREENKEIRDWARSKGIEVAERGRIPDEVAARWDTEKKRKGAA